MKLILKSFLPVWGQEEPPGMGRGLRQGSGRGTRATWGYFGQCGSLTDRLTDQQGQVIETPWSNNTISSP